MNDRLVSRFLVLVAFAVAACWPTASATAQQDADPIAAAFAEADALFAKGDFAGALERYTAIMQRFPIDKHPSVVRAARNAAWAAALTNDSRRALRFLGIAVKHGYRDAEAIVSDPHFAALRDQMMFQRLVNAIRRGQHAALDTLDIDRLFGPAETAPTPGPGPEPPTPGPGPSPDSPVYLGEIFEDGDLVRCRITNRIEVNIDFQGQRGREAVLEQMDYQDTILAVDEMGQSARRERVFLRMRQEVNSNGRIQRGRAPYELTPVTLQIGADGVWKIVGQSTIPAEQVGTFEGFDFNRLTFTGQFVSAGDTWSHDTKAVQRALGEAVNLLEGKMDVRVEKIERESGARIAHLASHLVSRMRMPNGLIQERDVQTTVWFNVDTHRPIRAESKGDLRIVVEQGQMRAVAATGTIHTTVEWEHGRLGITKPIAALRGWIGIQIEEANQTVRVGGVFENSPAHKAGVQVGDIVKKAGSVTIDSAAALSEPMRDARVGDTIEFVVERETETLTLRLTIAERVENPTLVEPPSTPQPEPPPPAAESALGRVRLGLRLVENHAPAGMRVQSASGIGEAAGLRENDVITHVRSLEIRNGDDLREALRQSRVNETVPVRIIRDGREMTLQLTLSAN